MCLILVVYIYCFIWDNYDYFDYFLVLLVVVVEGGLVFIRLKNKIVVNSILFIEMIVWMVCRF